jgi:hypothetical protein
MQRWLEPITGVSGDVVASLKRNDRRTMREWRQQVGDGMTILNVETEAQARELMDDEPLTRRGLRTYELRRWELREGRMVIELDTATSSNRLVRETTRC